jgi:6-phosphogluconate dehydrogenase (decarboxylating)
MQIGFVGLGKMGGNIVAALFARLTSRENGDYTARLVATLRNQFGGHTVKSAARL